MPEKDAEELESPVEESAPIFPFNIVSFIVSPRKYEGLFCTSGEKRQKYHFISYIEGILFSTIEKGPTREKKIQALLDQLQNNPTVHYDVSLCEECMKVAIYKIVGKTVGRMLLKQYKESPADEKIIVIGYTFCRPQDDGHLFVLVYGDRMDSQEGIFNFVRNDFRIPPFIRCP